MTHILRFDCDTGPILLSQLTFLFVRLQFLHNVANRKGDELNRKLRKALSLRYGVAWA